MKDSLQVAEYNSVTFMEILPIIIWPLATILIFLLLRKSLLDLINRISKIGYGKLAAETSATKQNASETTLLENETVQQVLGSYSYETISKFVKIVNNESKIEVLHDDPEKVRILHKYSQAILLIHTFERLYNVIFGSQLLILDMINTNNSTTKSSLEPYYLSATKQYPNFYANYSYDSYFEFLLTQELITITSDGFCQITFYGRDFLKFLVETGRSLMKSF